MKPPTLDRKALAVPAGFQLPWNTTRTMADVWRVSLTSHERRKAEKADLRRQADEAAARTPYLQPITPSGKIPYAGSGR